MKIIERRTIAAHEKDVIVGHTCDRCLKPLNDTVYDANGMVLGFTLEVVHISPWSSDIDDGWAIDDLCEECILTLRETLKKAGFRLRSF